MSGRGKHGLGVLFGTGVLLGTGWACFSLEVWLVKHCGIALASCRFALASVGRARAFEARARELRISEGGVSGRGKRAREV